MTQVDFVRRVERASRQRYAGRPTYAIGDFVPVAMVEDAWRLDDGRRIVVYGDSSDPSASILPEDYEIADPARAWVLVFVAPIAGSMPESARQLMARRGIVGYWPRAVVAVDRGRGSKRHLERRCRSLFHGYVLAHVPRSADLKSLLQDVEARRYGIGGPVRFGHQTAWIGDDVVEGVVRREREGEFDATEVIDGCVVRKGQAWQAIGSMVRIMAGPFQNFCAPVVRIDRVRKVATVTVSILGGASLVDIPLAEIGPIA